MDLVEGTVRLLFSSGRGPFQISIEKLTAFKAYFMRPFLWEIAACVGRRGAFCEAGHTPHEAVEL